MCELNKFVPFFSITPRPFQMSMKQCLTLGSFHFNDVLAPATSRVILEEEPVNDEQNKRKTETKCQTNRESNASVVTVFVVITATAS
mmetsp:Transcript_25830/g.50543  ORF Transcript_25830/g.50543 Transcript_25830/m.50543 type:complete len:87 (+) Transcript_25830:371-631(+)